MNWLDFKLGGRMLVKYPGLTVVGGLAMAFAIAVGVVTFQLVTLLLYPTLPLPGGERIVQLENWDAAANHGEPRSLQDFGVWREALRSVTALGAWRDSSRNLVVDGDARTVQVAEMSASGFEIASAEPLLGRVLTAADERAAAPAVAVIGYEVWRTRFNGDARVIGRDIELGGDAFTVVGVMREGFAFPIAHDVWLPLRSDLIAQAPRSGPAISIFGRLAPGETLETAQAELTTLGRGAAMAMPATHQHLEPRVHPYVRMMAPGSAEAFWVMFSMYFVLALLLILICGNVGLLLFARAATRVSDLVVRAALGASRARIVAQMFAEALVLGGVAACLGAGAAEIALRRWGIAFLEINFGRLPFWFDVRLSPATMLFAVALTVFGAAVAGVMPALKITRGMSDRLKQATAGAGGPHFGGVWSAVIVAQVAVTVAFPAIVYWEQFQLRRVRDFDPGFAAERYLTVRVEREAGEAAVTGDAPLRSTLEELRRRVAAHPDVAGVTFVDQLPATDHRWLSIELGSDADTASPSAGAAAEMPLRYAGVVNIDPSYFDVLGAPVLAGRAFTASDLRPGANVAIVDHAFVDRVLQGRNPLGQQVRFVLNRRDGTVERGPWTDIVGVVKELGVSGAIERERAAGLYLPAAPDRLDDIYLMIHVRRGDPLMAAPRVRAIAAVVDPALRLTEIERADDVNNGFLWLIGVWMRVTAIMTAVAVVLSLAGIYAVLVFTVAKRTREIGLRVALGASRWRVVGNVLRRPLIQVGIGVLVGAMLISTAGLVIRTSEFPGADEPITATHAAMLFGHAAAMFGVCLLACVVPTRRALGIEPTVALRTD